MSTTARQSSDNDICFTFGWFDDQLKGAVLNAFQIFWENKFEIIVQSVTENFSPKDDIASKGEIYFTSEMPIGQHQNSFIRMSSDLIRVLFHESFGSASPVFKLQELSELEIKILNSFCEFLNDEVKNFIIPHQNIPKKNLKNKGVYNVTFLIAKDGVKIGKTVLTLPQNCLDVQKISLENNFTFDDFLQTTTCVNILAGKSKLALNDLKSLYEGDIILLEDSNVNFMEIKTGGVVKKFKVNPEPSLMLELDEDEQELGADMADNKNIWDDIQIEVNAEFDKVKMTLGELKQISKGLVIDLGPVFNNKVSLLVENKVVAKGELVIINDKYGVKIDEIISSDTKQEPKPNEAKTNDAKKQAPSPSNTPAGAGADPDKVAKMARGSVKEATGSDVEEFDYSDFENEDN